MRTLPCDPSRSRMNPMDARSVSPKIPALRGFAFAVFASPDPERLHRLFLAFGFSRTQRHASLAIDLYEQVRSRCFWIAGPLGFRRSLRPYTDPASRRWAGGPTMPNRRRQRRSGGGARRRGDLFRRDGSRLPCVRGIGDSLICFVDDKDSWSSLGFVPHPTPDLVPSKGFTAMDHLTNNVPRGELLKWGGFYREVFGFTEVRYFDIRGVKTGRPRTRCARRMDRSASRSTKAPKGQPDQRVPRGIQRPRHPAPGVSHRRHLGLAGGAGRLAGGVPGHRR